jgi:hypothetical protein
MPVKIPAQQKEIGEIIMSKTKAIKDESKVDSNLEDLTLNKNRLITERQAAKLIGVSYESLKRSIRWNNRIPYYKVNKRVSYRVLDVLRFLEQCKVPAKS